MNNRVDSSLLVNPAAIAVWLVLCVIAVIFEKTGFGIFAGFVFVLTLSSRLWAEASLKEVDFELSVDRQGMFPGQDFTVTRIVRNRKALPMLWTEINEPCLPDDCAAPVADVIEESLAPANPEAAPDAEPEKFYFRRYTLSLIKWRQAVLFKDKWLAKRRGILEIDVSTLRSGDGFGLCALGRPYAHAAPQRLVVYPRLALTSVWGILNDMWDTRAENDGYLKDRTVIKSVRDYLPGDAARDVNNRLLARGLSMKTNVFETVTPDTVLFVLDAGSFRHTEPAVFERSLSVVASLIEGLTIRGVRVSLMTPASKWFGEACTPPSALESDRYRMFELLAAASRDDVGFSGGGAGSTLPDEPGRIYIVCADVSSLTIPEGGFPFPGHKLQYLTAEEGREAAGTVRQRSLFDFERAV